MSFLTWETSDFEISTTYVVWTQLDTTCGRTPGKTAEDRRPAAHLSEDVGAPGKKELRTQLRDSYRIP